MRNRLLLTVAVLAMATGCTTTSEGTPLPGPSTEVAASSTKPPASGEGLPSDGAPKVENPLDVSHFEQHPCDTLTAEDARTLNIPATGEQTGDAIGETCFWRNSETRGSLAVSFFSGDGGGLSSLYREAKGVGWPYFKRIADIGNHPAVAYNINEKKPQITCTIAVGLSDRLAFTTRVALSDANIDNKKDPCEVAARVAGMLMSTMLEAA
ncbi:DUF3558 domain-containing protein [Actinophytocola sp.]|uniref:DUF3558 domain-containing protein n=1 Tax=Actinophytocola sp. TaxID=1872138 RepID=UPI003899F4AC